MQTIGKGNTAPNRLQPPLALRVLTALRKQQ